MRRKYDHEWGIGIWKSQSWHISKYNAGIHLEIMSKIAETLIKYFGSQLRFKPDILQILLY
jgi:hypothetical protein